MFIGKVEKLISSCYISVYKTKAQVHFIDFCNSFKVKYMNNYTFGPSLQGNTFFCVVFVKSDQGGADWQGDFIDCDISNKQQNLYL